ncbi:hypothetical protein PLESTB_000700800 [Pleodorina starrii]|uniref:Tubby C-terminal domain-containing protein n=1 Tax=Pleodorina starrii TaxID=330485 RepID=A0A9W6BJL6_9CHLO|nr:hypothetical protein PLESTM_001215900 [Pleodorina starrii]GLC53033.1 hypothetical protein PLESTB_000700800 [Pleodorina starrii]
MATKLFRQAFRPKTHDDGDTEMRDLGATGIFRNLAFQETPGEGASSPKGAAPPTVHKKGFFSPSNEAPSSSEPLSSDCRESSLQCADMWASPPATPSGASNARWSSHQGGSWVPPSPSGGKRAASSSGCQTPKSHRLSILKQSRNVTEVEEIAARDLNLRDEPTILEEDDEGCATSRRAADAELTAVAPWDSIGSPTAAVVGNARGCAVRAWEEDVKRLILAGRVEDAVRWAAPTDGMIRCTVRRVKNFLGHTLAYHLFLDSGDTFLLAARKRKKTANSNYVLSTSQEDLGRDSEHRIAKLRANFVGTEYSLVSRGGVAAPSASRPASAGAGTGAAVSPVSVGEEGVAAADSSSSSNSGRQHSVQVHPQQQQQQQQEQQHEAFATEEMAVHYKQTVLTAKGGPRVMLIATPLPDAAWAPGAPDGSDSLAACLDAARRRELPPRLERQLCMLATRPPEWDPALKSYTLDFHGRVRASSVKNFQLVHWDHNTDRKGSDLVLQFGKVEEGCDDFALDFTYPLTLQKAFGIALASTDSKLCYAL